MIGINSESDFFQNFEKDTQILYIPFDYSLKIVKNFKTDNYDTKAPLAVNKNKGTYLKSNMYYEYTFPDTLTTIKTVKE